MNVQTGEIRSWDSLTEEQQKSGEWIKLPTHNENGVAMAERAFVAQRGSSTPSAMEQFFKNLDAKRLAEKLNQPRRFDAVGKPVG